MESKLPKAVTAGLAASVCALLLLGLGATDLWAPDEPRYAHVTDELLSGRHGARGLVLMHLNGEPYTQKPPLYFWLAALTSAPFGRVSEVSARLPSALAGIAAAAVSFALGRRLFGARAAAWGVALLVTVFDFAFLARRARLDVLLTLTAATALLAFWRLDRGEGSRRGNAALLHGAIGLGALVKGPVAWLPLLAGAAYLAWEGRLRDWRRAAPAWGWALSLGPLLGWIAGAAVLAPPGFFEEAAIANTVGRFFGEESKVEPWYFFAYQLPLNFLPWTLLWPLTFVEARRRLRAPASDPAHGRAWRFLLAVVATWLVFFSLSTGKRGLYLLPMFPALALLCGAALESWRGRIGELPDGLRKGALALLVALALAGGVLFAASGLPVPGVAEVAIPGRFGGLLLLCAGAGAFAWRRAAAPAGRLATLVACVAVVELGVFTLAHPAFEPIKSPRPIAEAAAALTAPDEPIGLYGHRAMVGGLAYYADRPVTQLGTPEALRRFVDGGGRLLATKAYHWKQFRSVAALEEAATFRTGKRRYLLLRATELR